MKNIKLIRILAAVVLCTTYVAIPEGNALAMPFKAAVPYPAGTNPRSVTVGDFNKDGNPDLAVANQNSDNISILLGNGNGTFRAAENYTAGTTPASIAVGDFNKDGNPDLAVANYGSDNVSILLGVGNGNFNAAVNFGVGTGPHYVVTRDFNKDGNPDLAVANYHSGKISILLGNGIGGFGTKFDYIAGTNPISIAAEDFNGDGNVDLAVANDEGNDVSILIGDGSGKFNKDADYMVVRRAFSVATGDFNKDNRPDLAVANWDEDNISNVSVFIGKGDGTFNAAVNYLIGIHPSSVAVGDFNMDGKTDVAVTNYTDGNVSILLGVGDGTLQTAINFSVGRNPHSIAVGDFNNDGLPDLAAANFTDNTASILLNIFEQPTLTIVNPAVGNPRQCPLTVSIMGTNLTGATSANFGTGITVNRCTVNSATQITAIICIDTNAVAGTRNVVVTTPGGTATGLALFTITTPSPTPTPPNPLVSTGTPTSHGSSVVCTITTQPVSLPNIIIQSASISSAKVSPGAPVTVTANVANRSTINGTARIKLYVNGEEDSSQGVTVERGGNRPVYFTISRSQSGTYDVYVSGTQAGSFTVEDAIEPNTLLFISCTLIALSVILGMVYILRRRDYNY